jgi:hypothetical protein
MAGPIVKMFKAPSRDHVKHTIERACNYEYPWLALANFLLIGQLDTNISLRMSQNLGRTSQYHQLGIYVFCMEKVLAMKAFKMLCR